MPLSVLDVLLACVVLCLTVGPSALAARWALGALPLGPELRGLGALALFGLSLLLSSAGLLRLVRWVHPLREGTFPLERGADALFWKLQGFLYVFNLGLLVNSYLVPVNLRWLVLRLLGARVAPFAMIGGKVLEPPLVEIGDGSQLGEDSLVTGHSVEAGRLVLGRVRIGRGVIVGVKAVVLPGVEIGDGAVVAAGAVVAKGTRVGPGEVWGGVPARRLR